MRAHYPPPATEDLAFFLDVDGTLIALAETPDAIRVDAALLALIARLYRASGGAVALITGRAIEDLEKRLGPLHLPLAGQHGLERRDAAGHMRRHAPPKSVMRDIKDVLVPIVARHPDLLLEDKGLTLALHYRSVPQLASYVHRTMAMLAREAHANLEVQRGKRVAEIKPAGYDKGTAVSEFLAVAPFRGRRPVFIGDDANDEHGFAEVNRMGGISIKVGKGKSCARYRLDNVDAVRTWLDIGTEDGKCAA